MVELVLVVAVAGFFAGRWHARQGVEKEATEERERVVRLINRHALAHRSSRGFVLALSTLRARVEGGTDDGRGSPGSDHDPDPAEAGSEAD